MNKVILIGNLTKDVEVRNTKTGKLVASVSLATNKRWTDNEGKKQEKAEFHNLVVWGKAGETFAKYLSKGSKVSIIGELTYEDWTDNNGIKRTIAKIIVSDFEFLSQPKCQETGNNPDQQKNEIELPEDNNEIRIEDIPF